MTISSMITANKNPLLLTGGFKMVIERTPNTAYFLKTWAMPNVGNTEVYVSRPTTDVYTPGSKLVYEPLECSMIISEDMDNYFEIYKWLQDCISNPNERSLYNDVTIQILNSKNNPHRRIVFRNAFPTSIGGFAWDVDDSDVTYATCDVSFRYDYFEIT